MIRSFLAHSWSICDDDGLKKRIRTSKRLRATDELDRLLSQPLLFRKMNRDRVEPLSPGLQPGALLLSERFQIGPPSMADPMKS